MMTAPVTFSFVGRAAKTADLKRRVLEIARAPGEFPNEQVADFGDLLAKWGEIKIGDTLKRELSPMQRLGHRAGLLFGGLEKEVAPKVQAGATLGFFDRLGFDAWYGANGHRLDLRTLRLWEAMVEHGLKALGFSPPACYFHTDGDNRLEHLLRQYCTELEGQRYEMIPPRLEVEEQAWCIIGIVHGEVRRRRMAA